MIHGPNVGNGFFDLPNSLIDAYNGFMIKYFLSLFLLTTMLILQIKGIHGWYYQVLFYDVYMHILGGVGVAFFISALIDSRILRPKSVFWGIVFGTLTFGFFWEFFEIYYNIARYPLWTTLYYLDTIKDLADDIIGGVVVAMISNVYTLRSKHPIKGSF